jgi:hypothetical protein
MSIFEFYDENNKYGKHWKFNNDNIFGRCMTEINKIVYPYGFSRYVIYWKEEPDDI